MWVSQHTHWYLFSLNARLTKFHFNKLFNKLRTDTETTEVEESVVSRTVRQKKKHTKTNAYTQLTLTNDDTHEMFDEKQSINPFDGNWSFNDNSGHSLH